MSRRPSTRQTTIVSKPHKRPRRHEHLTHRPLDTRWRFTKLARHGHPIDAIRCSKPSYPHIAFLARKTLPIIDCQSYNKNLIISVAINNNTVEIFIDQFARNIT
jgi:hypothetical protein